MTLNGKRDNFTRSDFEQGAKAALLKRGRATRIIDEVQTAVRSWPAFAAAANVPPEWQAKIQQTHRLGFLAE
jgi:hypothetical protein